MKARFTISVCAAAVAAIIGSGAALAQEKTFELKLSHWVPPSHPLARRSKVSITELARESFVAHHVSSPYRQRVIETFRKKRVELRLIR